MNIEICIINSNEYNVAKSIFADTPNITVINNCITRCTHPVIIAAGNSFAEMNGGVDGVINSYLSSYSPKKYMQEDVKELINKYYAGELPVGQSILLKTKNPRVKHLIYSPTMRVAEPVTKSLNPYLAFRSALLLMKFKGLQSASTTLFCTGAGEMDPCRSSLQMKEAYNSVITGNLVGKRWPDYHDHHRLLNSF